MKTVAAATGSLPFAIEYCKYGAEKTSGGYENSAF